MLLGYLTQSPVERKWVLQVRAFCFFDITPPSSICQRSQPVKRNKLWKALRIIHREWVRDTLVPTRNSDGSDDSDDFQPEQQSHPQPDLDLTEDIRILYTQNTDRD